MSGIERQAYDCGIAARDAGHVKRHPGYLDMRLRHWWLAGWNDRDIELTSAA